MRVRAWTAALVTGALGLAGCGSDDPEESPLSKSVSYDYDLEPGLEPSAPLVHTGHLLVNDGDETVRVIRIEPFPDTSILVGAENARTTEPPFEPFEPFDLAPDESRLVGIASTLRICEQSPAATSAHSSLLIRYRISDDEREAYLEGVSSPPIGEEHDEPCIDPGAEDR